MKTFLVIDRTHDDFCIMQTNDPALAIGTCQVLTPYECKQLEVWETEEDPETALTYNTIYRWDVEHGRQLPTEDNAMIDSIVNRLYDEESGETIEEMKANLNTIEGCHKYIDFCLNTIDSILE